MHCLSTNNFHCSVRRTAASDFSFRMLFATQQFCKQQSEHTWLFDERLWQRPVLPLTLPPSSLWSSLESKTKEQQQAKVESVDLSCGAPTNVNRISTPLARPNHTLPPQTSLPQRRALHDEGRVGNSKSARLCDEKITARKRVSGRERRYGHVISGRGGRRGPESTAAQHGDIERPPHLYTRLLARHL